MYTPFYGAWRTSAVGVEPPTYGASALLARLTLSGCFSWVGIAEETLPSTFTHVPHAMAGGHR